MPDKEKNIIWLDGNDAYFNGLPKVENPHSKLSDNYNMWLDGFEYGENNDPMEFMNEALSTWNELMKEMKEQK